MFRKYFRKGKNFVFPASVCRWHILWSWIGAFTGIALVSTISSFVLEGTGLTLIIGSFGASAVLIYGAVESPLAQPRNLIGGHFVSAIVGVACWQLLGDHAYLAAPAAVATAIAVMQFTHTLHPPGGATALIAVIGGDHIHQLGYFYVFMPATLGAVLLFIVAIVINHIAPGRSYPHRPKIVITPEGTI